MYSEKTKQTMQSSATFYKVADQVIVLFILFINPHQESDTQFHKRTAIYKNVTVTVIILYFADMKHQRSVCLK